MATKRDISQRLKDEAAGIGPGRVNLNNPPNLQQGEEAAPDLSELGLPSFVRRKLEQLVPQHVEYGQVEREAKKEREALTGQIKELWDHIGDEVKSFYCKAARVTRIVSHRKKLNETKLRLALLQRKVRQDVLDAAWADALEPVETVSLRITPPGGEE